ncbi:MAG: hypothetical protein H7318_20020 [Oligoflexus sp.]|nr:hypothetical protein [Oligoflexus sp.]
MRLLHPALNKNRIAITGDQRKNPVRRLLLKKNTEETSKLIERLLQKGLVTRAEATGDRRYQEIKLTKTAIKLVPKLAGIADENDEDFFLSLRLQKEKY